jgi:hypothetical protein
MAVCSGRSEQCHQFGIVMLEVVLVTILLLILFLLGLKLLLPLRGKAEEASVIASIGAMQASLGQEVAARVLRDGFGRLAELDGSNPVLLLSRPPQDYIGARRHLDPATLAPGSWAFDSARGVLVYRVRYAQYFRGDLMQPPRGEWRIALHYAGDSRAAAEIRGVLLTPLAGMHWLDEAP